MTRDEMSALNARRKARARERELEAWDRYYEANDRYRAARRAVSWDIHNNFPTEKSEAYAAELKRKADVWEERARRWARGSSDKATYRRMIRADEEPAVDAWATLGVSGPTPM